MAAAQRIREVDGVKDGWMDGWMGARSKGRAEQTGARCGVQQEIVGQVVLPQLGPPVRPWKEGRRARPRPPELQYCIIQYYAAPPPPMQRNPEIPPRFATFCRFQTGKAACPAGLTGGRGFGSGGRMAAWPELPSPEMAIVTTSNVDSGGERKERLYCRPILTMTAHAL